MTVTIVFDMDDTLYLERDYIRSGIAAVDRWAQSALGLEGLGIIARSLVDARQYGKLFDAALAKLGAPIDPSIIGQMVSVYRAHAPDIRLAPDALAFLKAGHDYGFALISDGFSIAQHAKVDALGLPGFGLDPIICTDDWGRDYWKPHRRAYEAVQAAHAARSTRFIYVADNPAKDFLTPRALGWATVQIDRPQAVHGRTAPSDAHRPHLVIHSFDQLSEDIIASLLANLSPTEHMA
ncbi:HAD family hydrolase [Sphingobium sp.]|uniref:HAD family hydrolase n=1 Tax=Sphingobium sp. TaxID=1912891 RepID=UPI002C0F3395|nr:HAD family hydrolase [Sphingobium sp.]HUD91503.1 HAD family hydrolase [Sphingobium sp.]